MNEERWLPIPGYEGRYDVSDRGRIRSWLGWNGNPRPWVLTPSANKQTHYLQVRLCKDGRQATKTVHALVMLAFCGPRPDGLETRHLNGDPTDCRRTNLVYGTQSENDLDRVRHGTHHNAIKTHCIHGHEYTEANTYHRRDGGRECRCCAIARATAWRRASRKAVSV